MRNKEKHWNVSSKYGFIYKWTDRKNNRYYIGSHWGKFNDGYICSSQNMRVQYNKRRETFTRRILAVVTTNRIDLLSKEQEYLDKIPRKDFGNKAYNVSTKVHKLWWAKNCKLKKQVIANLKKSWNNPERRKRVSAIMSGRVHSTESKIKMSQSAKKRFGLSSERKKASKRMQGKVSWNKGTKGKQVAWNRGLEMPSLSKKHKEKISKSLTGFERSPESKAKDSKAAKQRWNAPGYREKLSATRDAMRRSGKLKINMKQASKIQKMYATGKYTMSMLAANFKISASYIYNVINNKRWSNF